MMKMSPTQIIEIRARILHYWHCEKAPQEARARALNRAAAGDFESFQAWAQIAKFCETLRAVDRSSRTLEADPSPQADAARPAPTQRSLCAQRALFRRSGIHEVR
jgi:hypothetical protein